LVKVEHMLYHCCCLKCDRPPFPDGYSSLGDDSACLRIQNRLAHLEICTNCSPTLFGLCKVPSARVLRVDKTTNYQLPPLYRSVTVHTANAVRPNNPKRPCFRSNEFANSHLFMLSPVTDPKYPSQAVPDRRKGQVVVANKSP
jgi:hypothetical protein